MSTEEIAKKARIAAQKLASISGDVRNAALLKIKQRLESEKDKILSANQVDKSNAKVNNISPQLQKVSLIIMMRSISLYFTNNY